MKVVSAKAMAQLESIAYQQGHSEVDFMENAGCGIAEIVHQYIDDHDLPKSVLLLCGKGNNAGDAFVAGTYLIDLGYKVYAIQPGSFDQYSKLCQKNRIRFENHGGIFCNDFNEVPTVSIILDGIFGTGFKGSVSEPYASLILEANRSQTLIFAIDIPSGLDGTTGHVEGYAIQAAATIFLGLPKTGFFYEEGWNFVGRLYAVDFGLSDDIIKNTPFDFELIVEQEIANKLPLIKRKRHKYQAGFVVGLAGSPTMPGAAMLSSLACLRGGSGMVKLLYPGGMEAELSNSPYELIKLPYETGNYDQIIFEMNKAGATFVGPGLGRTDLVRQLLSHVIHRLDKPSVIDADALTLLAGGTFDLPKQAIITPHAGEMQKLLGSSTALTWNQTLLQICQNYAELKEVTLVLKGAPTFIFHPGEPILVNPTGDPGMATAGSGDVLTGLIASLLSQGLNCRDAAALGVYLHGLAGECAARMYTSYGMIASDLTAFFGTAIKILQNSNHKAS
jgi:NAD(P)H-hydrate epimerase